MKRLLLALAALFLLLGIAWLVLAHGGGEGPVLKGGASVENREPRAPTVPTLSGRPPDRTDAARPLPVEGVRVQLMDVGTMRPAVGVAVRTASAGASTSSDLLSDEHGEVTFPGALTDFTVAAPDWIVLRTAAAPTGVSDEPARAWLARRVRVSVSVSLEDPTVLKSGALIRLSSAPSAKPPGGSLVSPDTVGTPEWLLNLNEKVVRGAVESPGDTFQYDQVAVDAVAVVVSARGHEAEVQVVDFASTGRSEMTLAFQLRRGVTARIRVHDADGKPVRKATVQWLEDREAESSDLNPYVEMAIRQNLNTGLVFTGKRVAHVINAETNSEGRVALGPITHARRRYLVVWASGFLPYLSPEDEHSLESEKDITLQALKPLRESYRFTHDGEPITQGSLYLVEQLDGLTPMAPPIVSRADGSFPSDRIVPGKEYIIVLRAGIPPYTGRVTFGSEEVIDTSSFRAN